MTVPSFALRSAALAIAGVVAACGGTSPTSLPVAPTGPAATELEVPSFDLNTFSPPSSLAIPSFAGDKELEALLPDTIGGQVVVKQSLSGESIRNSPFGASPAIEGMLADVGATIDDMSLGVGTAGDGGGTTVVVLAYKVAGVSARRILDGIQSAIPSGGGTETSQLTVAGRKVLKFLVADETSYVYLAGDVVFIIGGTVTPELLEDAVQQLPAS